MLPRSFVLACALMAGHPSYAQFDLADKVAALAAADAAVEAATKSLRGSAPAEDPLASLGEVQPPALATVKGKEVKASAVAPGGGHCTLTGLKPLPNKAVVVAMRKAKCSGRYGSQAYVEVLYKGEPWYVGESELELDSPHRERLGSFTASEVEANASAWKVISIEAHKMQIKRALAEYKSAEKQGFVLLETDVYDMSARTGGAGFSVMALNPGRKTIKGVTFSVVGLSGENSPVPESGAETVTIRGAGPLAYKQPAKYHKDDMWFSDRVRDARVTQVRLDYSDGSSKVIKNIDAISLKQGADLLLAE